MGTERRGSDMDGRDEGGLPEQVPWEFSRVGAHPVKGVRESGQMEKLLI